MRRVSVDASGGFWVVVHRTAGPLATFETREEAEREREDILEDDPEWADDVWIEPFSGSASAN